MYMTQKDVAFIQAVRGYYAKNGRKGLPWRKTRDPYHILVSEIMLQQTQVDRVIPKYTAFLERFPDVAALAAASLREVLVLWQGLGYNRRAKMLHLCAQAIMDAHGGVFPKAHAELVALPGIGPYTASAVMAFAYARPTPFIETNIRSVYIHHYFADAHDVHDKELLVHIERTMPKKEVRAWYWGLMDYGTFIKKTYGNPNTRSKHHAVQSAFKGSDRQIRGAIIRSLAASAQTRSALHAELRHFDTLRIDAQIERLKEEGMIEQYGKRYQLP